MLGMQLVVYLVFALLAQKLRSLEAAKILVVFPYEIPSQCILLSTYLRALAQRGHELTVIHAYEQCDALEGVHYIPVNHAPSIFGEFGLDDFWPTATKWHEINFVRNYMVNVSLNVLQSPQVQTLLHSNASFDLVILEPTNTDPLFGFAAHFNASLLGVASCGADWNIETLVGHSSYSTLEPIQPAGFRNGGTLLEQLQNWAHISEEWLTMQLLFLPHLRTVYERFFPHARKSFADIRSSFSLILINQHFSLGQVRPNVPSMVEVAGMHVPRSLPPLPQQLADFVEQARYGVIYFAVGVEIQSKDLPAATLKLLLETFNELPQRVIWKYEGEPLANVSANVYLSRWLPQQSILAHPNVKLFITHGGQLSTIETAYYGKPALGLPLFYDQFRNMEYLIAAGMGISLNLNSLTKAELSATVEQLVGQPQYQRNALAFSKRFRDQPMHPLDSAIYWTEYVLRYNGAPHMRLSASNLKFIDYYRLDMILMVVGRFAVLAGLLLVILSKLRPFLSFPRSSTQRHKEQVPRLK